MESSRTTTSAPVSTRRLARSMASLGDPDVILGRLVEGGEDDLAADRTAQVGDLFRPLADEHEHQHDLGVAVRDGGGDRLQHHRLAGLRRGHDEPPLALADRGEQVDDPGRRRRVAVFQAQPLVGIERGQVVEVRTGQAGRPPVDRVHGEQRTELAARRAVGLGAGGALDQVALPEPVLADLRGGNVDVVRAAAVAGGTDEGVAVGQVDEAGHRDGGLSLFNLSRRMGDCCCHG